MEAELAPAEVVGEDEKDVGKWHADFSTDFTSAFSR
jgi:hypothetical protein